MRFFRSCNLVLPDRILKDGGLLEDHGRIVGVGKREELEGAAGGACEVVDCGGNYLSPGFIDVHTHGGGGASFMEPSWKQYQTALHAHLIHGTTTVVPASLARSVEEVAAMADIWKKIPQRTGLPFVPGLFLEGPYTSSDQAAKGVGAGLNLKKNEIRESDYRAMWEASDGSVVRWMAAPELEGAMAFGRFLRGKGIIGCMGHSMADYETVLEAERNGYSCVIHLFTTMSTVTRKNGFRHGGLTEAGLLCNDLDVELICDGCHLPPELIQLAVKCKGYDKIMLVSDSGPFAGTDLTGEQEMLGMKIIIEDGVAKMPDRSCFAGSIACADTLVRTVYRKAEVPLWAAVRMVTKNPARHLGLQGKKGELTAGADADLVIFDDQITVKSVYVGGIKIKEGKC